MMTIQKINEIADAIVLLKNQITDEQAVEVKVLYPEWKDLVANNYTAQEAGYRFVHEGKLYKTLQASLTFMEQWIPGQGTESMYARIDETHAGTLEDPIPYEGNMALEEGKYYIQEEVIYKCTRNTDIPVYQKLSELVGIYVELVG